MAINPTEPNAGHHALMTDLYAVIARYQSMPAIERVALFSQFLGQQVAEVPDIFRSEDVMRTVSANLLAGNQQAGTAILDTLKG